MVDSVLFTVSSVAGGVGVSSSWVSLFEVGVSLSLLSGVVGVSGVVGLVGVVVWGVGLDGVVLMGAGSSGVYSIVLLPLVQATSSPFWSVAAEQVAVMVILSPFARLAVFVMVYLASTVPFET